MAGRFLLVILALAVAVGGLPPAREAAAAEAFRAFSSDSYWNRPLPADAPVHPSSDAIIAFLKRDNALNGCPQLSGAEHNSWGMPIYWAKATDPTFTVVGDGWPLPAEFKALRIPDGARPMNNSDGEMVVYDRDKGYVAWLWRAQFDRPARTWRAGGGSVAYLRSNGLVGTLPASNDRRNGGSHRGLNGAVTAVRYDEVQSGAIGHVLKVGVHHTRQGAAVFPMVGSDGTSSSLHAPVQGMRLRIRPDVDLEAFRLAPQARVIARALQTYGIIVGDSTGGPIELKLEDTVTEGRGQLWKVPERALCAIPIEAYEVIKEGYVPPLGALPAAQPVRAVALPPPTLGSACPAELPDAGFVDLRGNTHQRAIACAAWLGIVRGAARDRYDPSRLVTRAQTAAFLTRTAEVGGVQLAPGPDRFLDDQGQHEDSINRLAAARVVGGTDARHFSPVRPVSRAQMASLLVRTYTLLGGKLPHSVPDAFRDDEGSIHERAMNQAAAVGLTVGVRPGMFAPDRPVARDQMASFLARTVDRLVEAGTFTPQVSASTAGR